MNYREYFINSAIWVAVAVLVAWGLSKGTLSGFDAALIVAAAAWPFAAFYCLRFSGLPGLILKLYAAAPVFVAAAIYFKLI